MEQYLSPGRSSITYSVSFCDSISDRERLLSGDEEEAVEEEDNDQGISETVPRSQFIDVATPAHHCGCCSARSLPAFRGALPSFGAPIGEAGYGSLPNNMQNDQKKVIYCIHGKPGGCCARMVTDGVQDNTTAITIVDDHCHQGRENGVDRKARRKLIIASILCVIFMIGEVIGGYLSGSLAIATDAAHLLTDFASFMISLFALWVAQRKPTRSMPFGWHRAEVIGALTSVLTIWVVTGILVYMAVERCIHQDFEIDAMIMLITSGIGVAVNLVMGLTLHQHGHSHGGHSHNSSGNTETAAETAHSHNETAKQNINVRAAFIHVLGDFIQSVGVFIAALVIYYKPTWVIVDPICTFLFSILVLATTFTILKDALLVLMEGIPRDVDFNDVLNTFLNIEGVIRVHNLRIWALSLDKTALSAHLAIGPNATSEEVLKNASRKIHAKYNFFEMTLQIEKFQPDMESCAQCQVPS